jgi:hypothetical protein
MRGKASFTASGYCWTITACGIPTPSMKRKLPRRLWALAALLSLYPVFVLLFTWFHVLRSDFEGGRHGPLDAYRHALASATVSYTLGEWAVNLVTFIFERADKDSNKMDRHNNTLGASIGSRIKSFHEIEPAVRQSVLEGEVDTLEVGQARWLPERRWREGRFW